jgi:hypothetical protein
MATQAEFDQTKADLDALNERLEHHARRSAVQGDGMTVGEAMLFPFAWGLTVFALATAPAYNLANLAEITAVETGMARMS